MNNKNAVQNWLKSNDYDYVIPHIKQNGNLFTLPIIDKDNYVYGNTYWYVTKDKQDYIKQLKLHKDEYTTTYYKYSHYFICF